MADVICECGHKNPEGTILCESCGRLLDEKQSGEKLADMRYEGSARRSQTYNKTIIDKIWNFFSSVKVGVTLIIIILVASAAGTILPQEMYIPTNVDPMDYYHDEYGWFGKLYVQLGFNNLYSSWWYMILIGSLGISLLIASIDRFFPLYRSLKLQKVTRHEGFLKRQRIFGTTDCAGLELNIEEAKGKLKKRHYRVREENGNLLAEKGRFARWGPYINHIGLIVFLIGAMLRSVPGMYVDKVLWLREGETKEVPGTNGQYFLHNKKFTLETYDKNNKEDKEFKEAIDEKGTIAKNYQSDVILYKKDGSSLPGEEAKLKKIKDYSIKVNYPLTYDHFSYYQVDYKLGELNKMSFKLIDKQTLQSFGSITIDLYNPKKNYQLSKGYSVQLMSYFPDFEFDNDKPATKSRIPNNPAFIFKMFTPDKPKGEVSFAAIKQTMEPLGENKYKMAFAGIETKNVTALTIRKDLTLGIIFAGGIIFMIGVVQGAYWNHRRIWIIRKDGKILLAGHTNKNWHGLKRDISTIIEGTGIQEPEDQLQEEKSSK
ncbi:cytochrome c biogenesis protein ResB [Bacillus sp. MUM 13]|uniref:cytochrome c biogenesis protein ResB n=1 Tax=Bacillus sp. MUM 13 TaxID=1678001 RepID=UPI0008F58C50|nr:cytochrome c biogenesis protein ResB [Bacillus sp. MUM 13]OIK13605.1 cytochrome C biogenesis protein [Bacillus sp. MUM 13]